MKLRDSMGFLEVIVESGGSGISYINKLCFKTARVKKLPDKMANVREDSLVTFLVDGGAGTSSKKVDKTGKMREVNSLAT